MNPIALIKSAIGGVRTGRNAVRQLLADLDAAEGEPIMACIHYHLDPKENALRGQGGVS